MFMEKHGPNQNVYGNMRCGLFPGLNIRCYDLEKDIVSA